MKASFNTFPQYYFIFLLLIIFLLVFFLPVKVLLATDYKTDKYIKSWRIKEDRFSIIYTHSVELTEVIETYAIEGDKIILEESYFKSYGAGLPATTPYSLKSPIGDLGYTILIKL